MKTIIAARQLAAFLATLLILGGCTNTGAELSATRLRSDVLSQPLNVNGTPTFSWQDRSSNPATRNQMQSAYQVVVASTVEKLHAGTGDLWDSGKVLSGQTAAVPYAGRPLASGRRAVWNVRLWNEHGVAGGWSEPREFAAGLFAPGDWSAKWIGYEAPVTDRVQSTIGKPPHELVLDPPAYLRKSIAIDKPIARATIYATALGLYELSINGQRVGADQLSPGWTDYHKRVHYQAYDVTAMLARGENAMGAIVANGWYSGYVGFGGRRQLYGAHPRFIAQLGIEYTDGTEAIFNTDDTWKATYGPWREADLLMGCRYDANCELGAWDRAGFDDSAWEQVIVSDPVPAKLEPSPAPGIEIAKSLSARTVSEPAKGTYVFDLGQNMVGWVRLKLATRPNQTIRVRYSEMLNSDGTLYTAVLRGARATDTFIARGGSIDWEPKFTFHGFRYVEVTGLDAKPSLDAVTGVVIHTRMDRAGEFECSNPLVNQLMRNIMWGQMGNYLDVPTDCPQRDERLGWTGDAQFFVHTAAYNFDVQPFFRKWLVDLCEDSANGAGAFGSVAPNILDSPDSFGATAWADAGIVCPHAIWNMYGDTQVIRDHYAAMAKYIDYLKSTSHDFVRTQGAYGDWVNLGGGAKSEVIGTAYFEHVTRLLAEMSAAIGKSDDAAKYRKLADEIRGAFIAHFVSSDGAILESDQTGYALAFAFDLLPNDVRQKTADRFVETIKTRDWHLATGFIGTPILLPALTKAGRSDVAYRLLEQESFPGWLFEVKQGATTMWERWDGWRPDKGFHPDVTMNSFNHYAFGSVGEWIYRTVGGIDSDGPGFKRILIHPTIGGDLTWARAKYESCNGEIKCEWNLEGGKLSMNVTIPPNTTAMIVVPTSDPKSVVEHGGAKPDETGNRFQVGSGEYHFTGSHRPASEQRAR